MTQYLNLRFLFIGLINYVNKLFFDRHIIEFMKTYEGEVSRLLPRTNNPVLVLSQYQKKREKLVNTKTARRNTFGIFLASFIGQYTWLLSLYDDITKTETFFVILGFMMFLTLGIAFAITKLRFKAYKTSTELRAYENAYSFLDNEYSLNHELKYQFGLKNKFMSSTNLYRFALILAFLGELKLLVWKLIEIYIT